MAGNYKGDRSVLRKPLTALKGLFGAPEAPADARNQRFIAVIECAPNQKARDVGAASFPAMNFELRQLCHRHGVGIMQMPCPEIAALGVERKRAPGQSLRDALDSDAGRCSCQTLAWDVADAIERSLAHGCQLAAILGGNPRSPGGDTRRYSRPYATSTRSCCAKIGNNFRKSWRRP